MAVKQFIIDLAGAVIVYFLSALLWTAFWTYVVPWPEHKTLWTVVSVLFAFGAIGLRLNLNANGIRENRDRSRRPEPRRFRKPLRRSD